MKKWIIQLSTDAVVWLCLYAAFFETDPWATYGTNGLYFIGWLTAIMGVLWLCAGEKSALEFDPKTKLTVLESAESNFRNRWATFSTTLEAVAMAMVGLHVTAFAYLFGYLILRVGTERAAKVIAAHENKKRKDKENAGSGETGTEPESTT